MRGSLPARAGRRIRRSLGAGRERMRARRVERLAAGAPPVDVEPAHTNLGAMMDAIVTRARRNQLPVGIDPDYDLARDHFDHLYFLLQAQHLHDRPEVDPIAVFLRNGAEAVNSPDPSFGMQAYLRRQPHRIHEPRSPYLAWLKQGRAQGEIADPAPELERMADVLDLPQDELARALTQRRTDLFERIRAGRLGEMFAKAVEVEPLIGAVWGEVPRARLVPLTDETVVREVAAVHGAQKQAGFCSARVVLVINRPRWGGGRRLEGHLAHALADDIGPDGIVVVYTDESGTTPPGRFPAGVREVDFAALSDAMTPDQRSHALAALLRSFGADAILNINSKAMYDALTAYGRALGSSERIFLVLFNNELRASGVWQGWGLGHVHRHFEYVAGIIADSHAFKAWLVDRHQLGPYGTDRIRVLEAPVDPDLEAVPAPPASPGRRPRVFWAGRLDRQKRVDLALAVARAMPEVDFLLWGERVLHGEPMDDVPANVELQGRYDHITHLPLDTADAWLYTSAWDGVPSLLLEVTMLGIPLVGTLVGGTEEILLPGLAWGIPESAGPEAYVAALREIAADPAAARARSAELRSRLVELRTADAFGRAARELLLRPATTEGS